MLEIKLINQTRRVQKYDTQSRITPRQREVLVTAANLGYNGFSRIHAKEVLEISPNTVNNHITGTHERLGVCDTFSAVYRTLYNQILSLDEVCEQEKYCLITNICDKLTSSEKKVLTELSISALEIRHVGYLAIALSLSTSINAIKQHIHRIYKKTGVSNQAQLAVLAYIHTQTNHRQT